MSCFVLLTGRCLWDHAHVVGWFDERTGFMVRACFCEVDRDCSPVAYWCSGCRDVELASVVRVELGDEAVGLSVGADPFVIARGLVGFHEFPVSDAAPWYWEADVRSRYGTQPEWSSRGACETREAAERAAGLFIVERRHGVSVSVV